MEVYTDASGFQFYTANWLDGSIEKKKGQAKNKEKGYEQYSSFCIETSEPPNAINMEQFRECVILNAKQPEYKQTTRFTIKIIQT